MKMERQIIIGQERFADFQMLRDHGTTAIQSFFQRE